jgi:hypothetical protein
MTEKDFCSIVLAIYMSNAMSKNANYFFAVA